MVTEQQLQSMDETALRTLAQQLIVTIVDRLFKTVLACGLSYVPTTGLSKHDRTKETQSAFG